MGKRESGLTVVCLDCAAQNKVSLKRIGDMQKCKSCGARFAVELKPNRLVRFCIRIFFLALLVFAMRAVTHVEFMPKWLYVLVVLIAIGALMIAAQIVLNIAALKRRNEQIIEKKRKKQ